MSKIIKWMRHLCSASSASRSPTTPEPIAAPEPIGALLESPGAPRAYHESQCSSSILKNLIRPTPEQNVLVVVFKAAGSIDGSDLVSACFRLFKKETHWLEFDVTLEDVKPRFFRNGYIYTLDVVPAFLVRDYPFQFAKINLGPGWPDWHHVSLVFTYDAASQASWDEAAATHDDIRSRCENWGVPFVTMLLGMGASEEEAAALASPRACLTAGCSPVSGKGVRRALEMLVEQAHVAGSKFPRAILPPADTSNIHHILFGSAARDG